MPEPILSDHEAADVWMTAHSVLLFIEGGQGNAPDAASRSSGDGQYAQDWCTDVRKLVGPDPDNRDTFLLDCVYGESKITPDIKSRRGAMLLLRKFKHRLRGRPATYSEYGKIRKIFFGD